MRSKWIEVLREEEVLCRSTWGSRLWLRLVALVQLRRLGGSGGRRGDSAAGPYDRYVLRKHDLFALGRRRGLIGRLLGRCNRRGSNLIRWRVDGRGGWRT